MRKNGVSLMSRTDPNDAIDLRCAGYEASAVGYCGEIGALAILLRSNSHNVEFSLWCCGVSKLSFRDHWLVHSFSFSVVRNEFGAEVLELADSECEFCVRCSWFRFGKPITYFDFLNDPGRAPYPVIYDSRTPWTQEFGFPNCVKLNEALASGFRFYLKFEAWK